MCHINALHCFRGTHIVNTGPIEQILLPKRNTSPFLNGAPSPPLMDSPPCKLSSPPKHYKIFHPHLDGLLFIAIDI